MEDFPLPERAESVLLLSGSLTAAIDYYWHALSHFQNVLEDVAGADGRPGYVDGLRFRLLIALQQMDATVRPPWTDGCPGHELADILENGAPSLCLSADDIHKRAGLNDPLLSGEALQRELAAFGDQVLARLPGAIPKAQGPSGQREVLRAIRTWSAAASAFGEDISFLGERIQDL